jgi:hypothetical protein
MNDWTQRILPNTDIRVGPCAWRLPMLATKHRDYVKAHPSLIVVSPHDSNDLLTQAAPHTDNLPILLSIAEPPFARQLQDAVTQRIQHLGRDSIDALILHLDDPAEIKSGGMLQTMFSLRDRGIVQSLGLAHPDPQVAEWLSINAAVRLLGVHYSLEHQAPGYRAITSANDYGMSTFALHCPTDDPAVRFALAQADRVLPVMEQPIPDTLTPMSQDELDHAWQLYKNNHPPPPPLKRGRPPMADA